MDRFVVRASTGISLVILLLGSATYALARNIECHDISAGNWAYHEVSGDRYAHARWDACAAEAFGGTKISWTQVTFPLIACDPGQSTPYAGSDARSVPHKNCEDESDQTDRTMYCVRQGLVCIDRDAGRERQRER
jgi:hypothetical protein